MSEEIIFEQQWQHPFQQKTVVFTGTLQSMTRSEAAKYVRNFGGTVSGAVTVQTDFVIVGRQKRDKSSKQIKAEKYIANGATMQILAEDEFLWLIQLPK